MPAAVPTANRLPLMASDQALLFGPIASNFRPLLRSQSWALSHEAEASVCPRQG